MVEKLILSIIFILTGLNVFSQNKYWVFLTDKANVEFNPAEYFDAKAIERRLRNEISLFDKTDFPLNQDYINSIGYFVDSIGFQSRWFNAVIVYAKENQLFEVNNLPFVKRTQVVQTYTSSLADYKYQETNISEKKLNEFLLYFQTKSMEGNLFEPLKVDGTGVRIAVFDGGFPKVDKQSEFSHIFANDRIKATYNFAKNKEDVYCGMGHGTMVLSNIAGLWEQKKVGLATGAEFLLAVTEVFLEPFSEEEKWLAAAEWADKNGADIINSSLGYTHHRYFIENMDGSSFVAKAAEMAFNKGILVVNSAGNDGDGKWKYIGTPADAEHVLSIGGISPKTNYHINFSSYGPTADGRFKPNVSAMGHTFVIGKKGATDAYGTSFSSPLVAGFSACVLQMNPNYTSKDLFREIQKSGSLYPYYDYAHGYGIPQASYFTKTNKLTKATLRTELNSSELKVMILEHSENENFAKNQLYYHIAKPNGFIKKYGLVIVKSLNPLDIDASEYESGDIVRLHYQGYTQIVSIP